MAQASTSSAPLNPIDKHFDKVSRYHWYFFTIFIISKVPSVWHTLNIIFLSPPMTYACGPNGPVNSCPCDHPVWDHSMFTKTVQTKYGILCERQWLISFSESTSFFGLLVGAVIFGVLSDRYGRLLMYSVCQVLMGGAGCLVAIMPNIYLFITLRFIEGIGTGGAIVTGFVLCMEFCGSSFRPIISSVMHFPANLGLIILAGISYMLRDCDHFQTAVSVPVIAFVALPLLIYESPKWLLENNHKKRATNVMEKFCRFNKNPCPTIKDEIEEYCASRTVLKEERAKFYHIFRYRRHTINFFCMAYLFFVCGMCYYGVSQFIGKMSTHIYINTVFNGLFLFTGTFTSIFIINRLGRRPFLRSTMFLAGAFMFVVVLMPHRLSQSWIRIMFACFSSTCFYVSFIITFLYGVELFPTSIRNSVFGILSLTSRIGQILGPQINARSTTVAGTVFGTIAIIASFVTFFLPETKGQELPSTLEANPKLSDKT